MPSREQIIEQSLELFKKHGLKAVRMDDIASELTVSKRTLYELFGNRESLILECARLNMECHRQQSKEYEDPNTTIIENFMRLIDEWETLMEHNLLFINDLHRYYPEIHDKLGEENYNEGVEKLKEGLKQGVEQGMFLPGLYTDFAARILTESLRNIFMSPNAYAKSNISQVEAFRYIVIYFFRGISTNKGRLIIDKRMKDHLEAHPEQRLKIIDNK